MIFHLFETRRATKDYLKKFAHKKEQKYYAMEGGGLAPFFYRGSWPQWQPDTLKDDDVLCLVTVAGRSNALSAFVDGHITKPVIANPPLNNSNIHNLHSSTSMPSGVAPLVILGTSNCALAVVKIFSVYNNLYKFNQYIPLINKTQKNYKNILKNEIQKGFRYMEINNKVFKIINILEYSNSGLNIILINGFIINVNNYYIKIHGYKNIEKTIDIDKIKLIKKSTFNYKLKPICISKYSLYN